MSAESLPRECRTRLRIRVRGAVQGVGFRPFVYQLASRHALSGYVCNDNEGVLMEVEGQSLGAFIDALTEEPPPLARIDAVDTTAVPSTGAQGFEIRDSRSGPARTRLVPDAATCQACLDDLFNPASRFHLYPFVTCTQCGPRFTIARHLPYDRGTTSMAGFPLCVDCARDYADPSGRRFHAEAIACAACGPSLSHAIADIAAVVRAGRIVALKGIGGFHLICDAENESAVALLRRRKMREEKPFAVMVANLATADLLAAPTQAERTLLLGSARPIVLMRGRGLLAASVAPGLQRIGIMLPYAPVHHLLFHALDGLPAGSRASSLPPALVATSANLSGEPLVIDDDEARARLSSIADLIVTHDRPILARADDSVMAVVNGAPAYLRRSRGVVPEPVDLGQDGPVVAALGGHLKTTVTVTRGREAFVSQHIGDLDTPAARRFLHETLNHLLDLLDVKPEAVACDLHPDFYTTRQAAESDFPVFELQHHAAHVAAVAAEHGLQGPLLGLALDGYGRGDDGGAWGGELLRLEGADWRRLGHLMPLALPGGDRAAREPWRMGVAALAALHRGDEAARIFSNEGSAAQLAATIDVAATTTSMGRLFDAAAALVGLRSRQTFEGQAAMELEALVETPRCAPRGYRLEGNGVINFLPLLETLLQFRGDPRSGAELFHGTLMEGLADWVKVVADQNGISVVALGGGCFMNKVLTEGLVAALAARGLNAVLPRLVPANDGGLSLGQAYLARHHLSEGKGNSCASPYPYA